MKRRKFIGGLLSSFAATSFIPAPLKAEMNQNLDSVSTNTDWQTVADQFRFQSGLRYFNNGSLGGTPALVHDATNEFRRQLDSFPSHYMWHEWWDDRETVRNGAAEFLGAKPDEIALTHNTCEGLNLVASSLRLNAGDEIIASDHEHHTGVIPLQHYLGSKGVTIHRPRLPLMPKDKGELIDAFRPYISSKVKAILISHVVNTNGMIMPVEELCDFAHTYGIRIIIDGAQAVGMIPVNVKYLRCHFYAASGHKWLYGPKGTGLFYVDERYLDELHPLIVSKAFYEQKNARKFENYNTRNMPEVLGLGAALDWHHNLGKERQYKRILELKHYLRNKVTATKFLECMTPASDKLSAGITAIEVKGADANMVAETLLHEFQIDCRPMTVLGLNALRISTAPYITLNDIDYLIDSLSRIHKSI